MLPGVSNARWIALRLLEGDESIRQGLLAGDFVSTKPSGREAQAAANEVTV